MKAALKAFWDTRTERDRIAIGAAAILIALSTAYACVWLPVTRERNRLLASVPQLQAVAQEMDRDAAELMGLKGVSRKSSLDLKAAIEQTAAGSGIALQPGEILQLSTGSARVTIASAQPALGFTFVGRLQSAHGVKLDSLRVVSLVGNEHVRLEAVFARAP